MAQAVKNVDDYIKEAWQALLKGDTARRDELCRQAQRVLDLQKNGWSGEGSAIRRPPPAVIHLSDRSGETIQ